MKNRTEKIVEFFFPKTCAVCESPGEYLCAQCKKLLTPHLELCPYCHKPSADYHTCFTCKMTKKPNLEGLIIPFSYTTEIKKLIIALKYKHQSDVADFLAERMNLAIQSHQKLSNILAQYRDEERPEWLIVTYIPSHRYRKKFVKGYNQSEILAEKLHEKLLVPMIEILKKPEKTVSQALLKRAQRLTNLQGSFKKNPKIILHGNETILIVDDVTTTGSTIEEAAKTIKDIYPNTKIWGIVLARHI